jgi:hypothetical protein
VADRSGWSNAADVIAARGTPIVAYVRGDNSDLKPGAKVFIAAVKQPDGTFVSAGTKIFFSPSLYFSASAFVHQPQ